jgi:hypothetical protein
VWEAKNCKNFERFREKKIWCLINRDEILGDLTNDWSSGYPFMVFKQKKKANPNKACRQRNESCPVIYPSGQAVAVKAYKGY